MAGDHSQAVAASAQRLHDAHQALRADPNVQFVMGGPPRPQPPPAWLKSIGDFFEWLGKLFKPVGNMIDWISGLMPDIAWARFLLWSVIIVALVAVVILVVTRLRGGEWRMPWRRKRARAVGVARPEGEEEWVPDAEQGRAWLEEADRLAAEGRYAEAVHHLLFRSIEDIQRRRPKVVRPALTSRELAAADGIPTSARGLFAGIARHVERSLFGGREVGSEDWQAARADYADFALPKMWSTAT